MSSSALIQTLYRFGATDDDLLIFDQPSPSTLNYLDLIPSATHKAIVLPNGVIESNEQPVLYFIDSMGLASGEAQSQNQINAARKVLACRGENSLLGVVSFGQITLYPCVFGDVEGVTVDVMQGKTLIRDLTVGALDNNISKELYGGPRLRKAEKEKRETVRTLLFKLLNRVSDELFSSKLLANDHEAVLALTGRALFTRFLLDRNIINPNTFPEVFDGDSRNSFRTPGMAAQVNHWLDKTFNGELLPLPSVDYEQWFSSLDDSVFVALTKILSHTTDTGQMYLKFVDIDFAHVPVGLLSEVYESYAHRYFEKNAKQESIHYTPRPIAELMVSQSFAAIKTTSTDQAKILDPSCGAGIFIILCFKRLIYQRWLSKGERPNTAEIREIMYEQLRGFDINIAALKLAALGLYLTALEVEADPFPPTKLKFEDNLIGTVLHCSRMPDEPWNKLNVKGSLGSAIGSEHDAQYDLVIGNPPWTAWKSGALNRNATELTKRILLSRDKARFSEIAKKYENPDKVSDLAFVWRSMEWAKQDGIIAFAMHGRLLFKRSTLAIRARNTLFSAIQVTGILNAAALRLSNVWPEMQAQFCLFFARNNIPSNSGAFHFISPQFESHLNNRQGRMRIDYLNAETIRYKELEKHPSLLKSLFRGTQLDVNLIDKIESNVGNGFLRLSKYWDSIVGKRRHGQGFQVASKSKNASFILEMGAKLLSKKIEKRVAVGYSVKQHTLPLFDYQRLHTPRWKEIYEGPLILFNESPGQYRNTKRCKISLESGSLAYNESYIGYSAHGLANASDILKYLLLLGNSDLFIYYMLMTSSKYGVEREVVLKEDIDNFPVIPFDRLNQSEKRTANEIADQMLVGEEINWDTLNSFVNDLYGISKNDAQVMNDTLSISLPTSHSRKLAESKPDTEQVNSYRSALENQLRPFFELAGDQLFVSVSATKSSGWCSVTISTSDLKKERTTFTQHVLSSISANVGASRIVIPHNQSIEIVMPLQYRYWTLSRARLLAIEILKNHGDIFRRGKKC